MTDDTSDRVWALIERGSFQEAVALGSRRLSQDDADAWQVAGNLAQAYLALGQFEEAYRCYARADELRQRSGPPGTRYLDLMAQAAWLCSDHDGALEHAQQDVALLAAHKTFMTDAAGGVSNALFLYYCGVVLRDRAAKERATAFIRKLSRSGRRFEKWPGPLGAYVLDMGSFEQVLLAASRQTDLKSALVAARDSLLIRRELIEALFYAGAKEREKGNEAGCLDLMRYCVSLQNPHLELEWYLATEEVARNAK